jgi:hypothetical protein
MAGTFSVHTKHCCEKGRLQEELEEEVVEDKTTFLDVRKGLEATTTYMCQFDSEDSITVQCSKAENEPYRLRTQEEKIRVLCSNTYILNGLLKFCYKKTNSFFGYIIPISLILHFPQLYTYFKVVP